MADFMDEYREIFSSFVLPKKCDLAVSVAVIWHHIQDMKEYVEIFNQGNRGIGAAMLLGWKDIWEVLAGLDRAEERLVRVHLQDEIEVTYITLKGLGFDVRPPQYKYA